jgi:microcystin synthetase protein McyG
MTIESRHGKPAIADGGSLNDDQDWLRSLAQALAVAAEADGAGVHFIDLHGVETFWSYRQLYGRALSAAACLRDHGIKAGDKVLIRLADPCSFVLAFWACVVGGYVAVPLAAGAPWPADERMLSSVLASFRQLDARALIVAAGEYSRVDSISSAFDRDILTVVNASILTDLAPFDGKDISSTAPADLAIIFPTSGSTGQPKPVTQSIAAILAMCAGSIRMNAFGGHDVFLNWMPLEHVGSVVFLGILPVCAAATQVQIAHDLIRNHPLLWLDYIERFRATAAWVPNYVFSVISKELQRGSPRRPDLSSMRFLVNAGESVNILFFRRFVDSLRDSGLTEQAIRPAFGMSETCSGITWGQGLQVYGSRYVGLGRPIPGAELRIVDKAGRIVEEGRTGRLHVRGPSVTAGYYKAPKDEKFLDDGWFDTGDSGLIVDGQLYLTDREGDAIGIPGSVIHSYEIEAQIEAIDGIRAGYTAVCSAERDDHAVLGVFYCIEPDYPRTEFLADAVKKTIVGLVGNADVMYFPSSPRDIPKTSIGKIQRKALRKRLQQAVALPAGVE